MKINNNIPTNSGQGPLSGIRVLDLSRILAGPTCTQLLGDLGADIIKVERPSEGDDTRKWGPPFIQNENGEDTTESAYYLSSNRNKRSVSINLNSEKGQQLVRRMALKSDVLVENFKVGGMLKFNLDYDTLNKINPGLVYCSISGFGQDGPYAHRAGYDFLIQAMGGIMSITGPVGGEPYKVGLGIADVMCGMYAATAILAALRHRDTSGEGQHIDLSLLDCQVAWLINSGLNYLTSEETPTSLGNAHPNIVPYEVFPCSDGFICLAVGNDAQYQKFCQFANHPELADDKRFKNNQNRVKYRTELIPLLRAITQQQTCHHWIDGLEQLNVPCGPVNNIKQAFGDPQIKHRQMQINMPHPLAAGGSVDLIGNPIKLSKTPVRYQHAPPLNGQHSEEVLTEILNLSNTELRKLRQDNVI